ncbi:MAG: ABC transporter substrate-binding protein [Deltaproteobacteria bacterium]|nr:ABC transporter substrate-binding protein [Deltaproteobacteria bacterium]
MKISKCVMVICLVLGFILVSGLSPVAFAKPAKTLKLGNTVPMQRKEGIQIKKWLELLAERLNKSGGLVVKGERYNVEIISYDDEYSADKGRVLGERLIYQDKVKHIIAQWGSPPILGTLTVAEPNKVFMVCNGATEKTMTPQWHYIYRCPSLFWNNGLGQEYISIFKKRGLPMTTVIINPDIVSGRGSAKRRTMHYNNVGVKILDKLFYKAGTTDYTPYATKIKSLNPGFIETGTTPAGMPTLLLAKALHQVGYKGGIIFNNLAGTYKDIIDKVGPQAIEGSVTGFKDPRQYRKEKWVLDLCDAYEKKYGVWEIDSINWCSGWFVFMAAVKKANSLDVDDLCKAMDGLEVDTLECKNRFVARPDKKNSRTCDAVPEQMPGIIRNGKLELVRVMSVDDNYRETIKAYGLEKVYGLK